MSETPKFFVPGCDPSEYEEKYAALAERCRATVPPVGKRIWSITFEHNGEQWTATVGESLKGTRQPKKKKKRTNYVAPEPVSDPAVVWAIFPGDPYIVVTNHRSEPGTRSQWENPFMAGSPKQVKYFAK